MSALYTSLPNIAAMAWTSVSTIVSSTIQTCFINTYPVEVNLYPKLSTSPPQFNMFPKCYTGGDQDITNVGGRGVPGVPMTLHFKPFLSDEYNTALRSTYEYSEYCLFDTE